ncbi:AMP-binding protein [Alphaproteobacteria bacterium]|nr:AMP-binding protein [Alphaproteobacteria bacterium]
MSGSLREQLEQNAAVSPNAIWLTSPETGQQISWKEALTQAQRIAAHLKALGTEEGASIAIASHNSIGACLAIAGITYGGYLATPLNLVAGAKVMSYVLNHCKADVIFCAPDNHDLIKDVLRTTELSPLIISLPPEGQPVWPEGYSGTVAEHAPSPQEQTPGILMYTSGTTGNPKGVVLSHGNLLAAGRNPVEAHHITSEDTGLCVLPIYHINGLCVTVMGTLVSTSQLIIPYKFSVSTFWQQVYDYKVSWFSAVPTLFAYLLNDETEPVLDRARLRFSRSASAPLSPEIHRRFEARFGIPIIETMGLTETGAQILSNPMPPQERKIGSPGIAVGNEIIIADENLHALAAGMSGEILVRGENVMQEYLHQPDETAKTITSDGWLRTGDIGHMDDDGYVFVTGRIKELIIKGGENIAPREIDEVLLEHDVILEAAAFAVPCENYGQRVEACIRFKPGKAADVSALLEHCQDRLGKFKCPDNIHILDDLPKGPSGKVQRLKLFSLVYQET